MFRLSTSEEHAAYNGSDVPYAGSEEDDEGRPAPLSPHRYSACRAVGENADEHCRAGMLDITSGGDQGDPVVFGGAS
jgi:hypothetical protein